MINEVLIKNIPQFRSELKLNNLNAVNFIFGNNGTGKTSISRILNNINDYSDCSIMWENDVALQIMVYNRDYVENNFFSKENIEGIFTLGSDNVEAEKEIISLEKEKEKAVGIHNSLLAQLNGYKNQKGKKKELEELDNHFVETCWQQKINYDNIFKNAFKGKRGDKKDFKKKILDEYSNNQANLLPLDNLQEKAAIIFNKKSEKQSELQLFDISNLIKIGKDTILSEAIVGNQEIDLSFIIDKLGNSDWVKQGMHFHDKKRDTCPYCQQYTDQNILEKLHQLFDQNYEEKVNKVKELKEKYKAVCDSTLKKFEQIKSLFLDEKLFNAEIQVLRGILHKNIDKLDKKILEPSQIVSLGSVEEIAEKILRLLNQANIKIKNNNTFVDNIDKGKKELISQIWRYVIEGFRTNIEIYIKNKNDLNTHIDGLNKKIISNQKELEEHNNEIKKLKKQCHSIEPIKNELNNLLEKFDFTSFHIETTQDGLHYQICRENGDNATCSLSEGEKTFITFLYFYWQIQNKNTLPDTVTKRVVVFDDPISSLDSNILYIISSLIKHIIIQLREKSICVQQIFILTHNVYFHKEITYHTKRQQNNRLKDETFWIVKKSIKDGSAIDYYDKNPIRSSYELLWEEIKSSKDMSSVSLQNTLRRILENYFRIWGNWSNDDICVLFSGDEHRVCQSLFSWVNDGSHSILDDLYIAPSDYSNELYLKIFEEIFQKTDQYSHYKMMMSIK